MLAAAFGRGSSIAPVRISESSLSDAQMNNNVAIPSGSHHNSTGPNTKRLTIHRICLFGFDENKGNSLLASSKINKKPTIVSHTDAELAEMCLPDGGHVREQDAVPIIFTTNQGNDQFLFGYSVFRSVRDAREKRGARQAALLLISDSPGMDMFRPFLLDALEVLMTGNCPWGDATFWSKALNVLKATIEAGFNSRTTGSLARSLLEEGPPKDALIIVELWNRTYSIRPPTLSLGDFGGTSLKDLLKVFREKTMKLWYAVAAERRVMFVGHNTSAASVANLVLALPLLVGELAPFVVTTLEPYVTLAVVDRITKKRSFIAGTNNALFLHKTEWWDVCCDINTGTILEQHHSANSLGAAESEENPLAAHQQQQSSGKLSMRGFRRKLSSTSFPKPSQLHSPPSTSSVAPSAAPSLHPHRSMGTEMAFVSRVLHDMEFQSEAWLRRQFHDFTLSFLNRVGRREAQVVDLSVALAGLFPGVSIMQPRIVKFAEQFPLTNLWKRYRAKQDEVWGGGSTLNTSADAVVTSPSAHSPLASPSSPSGAAGRGNEDVKSFLYPEPSSVRTLAPFHMDSATGGSRAPTGFISVKDIQKNNRGRNSDLEPAVVAPVVPAVSKPVERWVRVVHESGEPYYWNVASGETRWDTPDEELL